MKLKVLYTTSTLSFILGLTEALNPSEIRISFEEISLAELLSLIKPRSCIRFTAGLTVIAGIC